MLISITADLGSIGVIPADFGEAYVNQHIALVRIAPAEADPRWVGTFLASAVGQKQFYRLNDAGAKAGLNLPTVGRIVVALPTLVEQQHIVDILDTTDAAIHQSETLIAKLKQVGVGLLKDLLTRGLDENGEFRDPVDHPEQFKDSPIGRIPTAWNVVSLADVCTRITDGVHQTVQTVPYGVPFLYVSCVRPGQILWDQAAQVEQSAYEQISKGRVPRPGMILYTAVGSYGHAALVEDDRPFSFQRHIACMFPLNEVIESRYMVLWLNSPWCRGYADTIAVGNAQKTVTLSNLARYPVPLPTLEEQRRLTMAIDTLEARIRAEETYRDNLRLLKQGLMDDLLTGRVRVPVAEKAAV